MSVRPRDRFLTFRRDNFTCQYCGRTPPEVKLECDHVIARARGGADDIGDLITSCRDCNIGKRTIAVVPAETLREHTKAQFPWYAWTEDDDSEAADVEKNPRFNRNHFLGRLSEYASRMVTPFCKAYIRQCGFRGILESYDDNFCLYERGGKLEVAS